MKLSELFAILDQDFTGEDQVIHDISTDTRTLKQGDVFIALRGENFDGHDYLQQALEKGAIAAVVDHRVNIKLPQCLVEDTLRAYGKIARNHREKMKVKLAALTGSCGKTTVKAMLAEIFLRAGHTHATDKNFNNEVGVPQTILQITPEHGYAVIEMGANLPGEIKRSSETAQPDIAIITMVTLQHPEGMGDLDNIAREKGAILTSLRKSGTAILPKDDEYFHYWESLLEGQELITFGFDPEADVTATKMGKDALGHVNADIKTPTGSFHVQLKLLGRHNIYNALAATAAGVAAGLPLSDICAGLETMQPVDKRLKVYSGINQSTLIDDCYNASPTSIKAALEVLSQYQGERLWVFGDMAELADYADQCHREVGEAAKALGIDYVFAVGEKARITLKAFGEGGQHFTSKDALVAALTPKLHKNMTVLVKGSRGNKFETVVAALKT